MTKTIYCDNLKEFIEAIVDQRVLGEYDGAKIKLQCSKKKKGKLFKDGKL